MVSKDMLDKFPIFWKPVIGALMSSKCNSKIVEEVMLSSLQKNSSARGSTLSRCEIPDWYSLLKILCEEEPILTENGIHLIPIFVCLSFHAQRCMITFLEKHKAELPITMLQMFLKSIQDTLKDDWCKLYHHLLHMHILNAYSKVEQSQTMNMGFISQKSNNHLEKLCHQIKSEENTNRTSTSHQPHCHWLSEFSGHSKQLCDWSAPCVTTESQISHTIKQTVCAREEWQSSSSPPKRKRVEHSVEDIFPDVENDISGETENGASVSQELSSEGDVWKEKLEPIFSPLKEVFQSSKPSMTPAQIDLFKELMTLPLVEVEAICTALDIHSLPLPSLGVVVQQMVTMPTNFISFTTTKCLARCLFTKKISELNEKVSRNLLMTISQFSSTYSKPLLDGCLIPYIQRHTLGPYQAGCMLKIAEECLDNHGKILLLRAFLQSHCLGWNEHVSGFVQGIISCKMEVDLETINITMAVLSAEGEMQKKCPKFSKLILEVIKKFKTQLTDEHKTLLVALIDKNESNMKKALASAVKKVM